MFLSYLLYYIVSYPIILYYHGIFCYSISCSDMWYCILWDHRMMYCVILELYYVLPCCITLSYTVLYYTIVHCMFCIMIYDMTSFYSISYCMILYYVVLYCMILCYSVLYESSICHTIIF